MSKKTKTPAPESSHEKSSSSELKSLGSTSSITIPKSSPVKKIVPAAVVFLGLGAGGYFFSASEMGKNLLGSSAADSEEVAKDDGDVPAAVPNHEGIAPDTGAGLPQDAALPPQGPNPPAAALTAPPPVEPVKAAIEAPAPAKKAVVTKSSKQKKGKAIVSKKSKTKKVIAKKSSKSKIVASKKAKAKKTVSKTPAQAAVAPADQ